jgi:uncharacterized membrane protein YfcA
VSPPIVALLAFAGFCAGLVDSIAGGGGLLTVPALLATGMPPAVALATNKGQACFGAVSSFGSYFARGNIDRARAPLGFACGYIGSLAGARVLFHLRPEPLKPLIVVLLLGAAAFVAWPRKPREGRAHAWAKYAVEPVTLALGFYDGLFGPGVGSMLIVAFGVMFGDTLTRASGNAKAVNLASNLAALGLFAFRGSIVWSVALPMAVANATGAFVGSRLAVRRGDRLVRPVVLLVVAAVVVKMVYDIASR